MNDNIAKELSTNFIEYACAVNTDRAIPNAEDGLKPVAKRILWGMLDKTCAVSSKPHIKSAKAVGDIIGTYHPHGDTSVYEALIRLSQPWIMRYPLIDIHGNNGNIMGDGAAAMRYTEARLSKLSEEGMLEGTKKNAVDFIPNYDETTIEPVSLPSIFPNLLCNPNSGIGVAMACSWAPHNLKEVAAAIIDYMDEKEPILPGPDFPTGGIIINKDDIPNIMKTGRGSVKVRGRYYIEDNQIIFTEIPYGITSESLLNEIGAAAELKKIEGISDIRDESNKKGLRIVIECEDTSSIDKIVNLLFQKTSLQTNFSYNQVALVDKKPTNLNLEDCIKLYIEHNKKCLIKESNFDLTKAKDRLENVDGLLKALKDIDSIIALIKKSGSAAAAQSSLINKYGFTEKQTKAILSMRLSSLGKMEGAELQQEQQKLINRIKDLENLILKEELQKEKIKERLLAIKEKYGDSRKTELQQVDQKLLSEKKEKVCEDVIVTLNQNNNTIKVKKGKNKNTENSILTNTEDTLLLFSNKGQMYKIPVNKVSFQKEEKIKIPLDEKILAISSSTNQEQLEYILFFTKKGLVKKAKISEYINIKKNKGTSAIKLREQDSVISVIPSKGNEEVILITKEGMTIRFESQDIAATRRTSQGVKAIKLGDTDEVVAAAAIKDKNSYFAVFSKEGKGKKVKLSEYSVQGRGGKGVRTLSDGDIGGAAVVGDKGNLSVSSITLDIKNIPILNRSTIGKVLIKVKGKTVNQVRGKLYD